MTDPHLVGLLTMEDTAFDRYIRAIADLTCRSANLDTATRKPSFCIAGRLMAAQHDGPAWCAPGEPAAREALASAQGHLATAIAIVSDRRAAYETAAAAVEARMVELGIPKPEPAKPLISLDALKGISR